MDRVGAHARQFRAQHPARVRGERPKSQFVIEPPGARRDRLVIAFAELILIEAERFGAEYVPHHRQGSGKGVGRLAAAKALEDVEGHRGRAPDRKRLAVANRDAVVQDQVTAGRRDQRAALRRNADQCKAEPAAIVDQAHVVRVAIGECVEIARTRHHSAARKLDQLLALARRHQAHRTMQAPEFLAQVRTRAPQRFALIGERRRRVPRARARGRVRPGLQFVTRFYRVVEGFAREPVARHRGDAAHEKRSSALAAAAQPVYRRECRRIQQLQRCGFGPGENQRQRRGESVCNLGFAAIDDQALRPALREPAQGGPKKTIADCRARDPAVGERRARASEIGPQMEPREHAVHLRQQARIVRIRAQEAQHLVQAPDRARRAQIGARQPAQQFQLRLDAAGAVLVFAAFERA